MKLEDEIRQSSFRSEKHKLLLNLMFTSSWLQHRIQKQLKNYDLSPQQFNVLRILRGQHPKPVTITLIQERMLDRQSNASRLVDKLRKKMLVHCEKNPDDRRFVLVQITDKGLELLKTIDQQENDFVGLLQNIDDREAQQLNQLLDKIRE